MSEAPPDRPRALQRNDRYEDFDCGNASLNDYHLMLLLKDIRKTLTA
jgi:hypothetical protein